MKVIVASNLGGPAIPIGSILYWGGLASELPDGWEIFTEAADAFIMGTDPSGILLTKQGNTEHYHTEKGTDTKGIHSHDDVVTNTSEYSGGYTVTQGTDINSTAKHKHSLTAEFNDSGNHYHTISNTSTNNHLPKYIRFYLMKNNGSRDIPIKAIALWSGNLSTIPQGWRFCDGSTQDDFTVPNIKEQIIYTPTSDTDKGQTGGYLNHTHTRSSQTANGGAHTHVLTLGCSLGDGSSIGVKSGSNSLIAAYSHYHLGTINSKSSGSHYHTLPAISYGINDPPYICLYYIMKVA